MIELRDMVTIETPPEKVWTWLCDLPGHYREWHPAHVRCWYERGSSLEAGAVIRVEEELHGHVHRLRLRATEIVPNRLLRYASRGLRGSFLLEQTNGGTRLTATLSFGVGVSWIDRVVDRVLGPLFASRIAAVQRHLHEEGRNLKRLLEHGHAPARSALQGRL